MPSALVHVLSLIFILWLLGIVILLAIMIVSYMAEGKPNGYHTHSSAVFWMIVCAIVWPYIVYRVS